MAGLKCISYNAVGSAYCQAWIASAWGGDPITAISFFPRHCLLPSIMLVSLEPLTDSTMLLQLHWLGKCLQGWRQLWMPAWAFGVHHEHCAELWAEPFYSPRPILQLPLLHRKPSQSECRGANTRWEIRYIYAYRLSSDCWFASWKRNDDHD